MAKPTKESAKGFSTERHVTVYRWWDLTTFGVVDDADDGAAASFQLLGDGVEKFATTQSLATSAPVTVDISGVFRLKYNWSVPVPAEGTTAPKATPVMAGPEVLCAF